MSFILLPLYYITWHYSKGISDFVRLWKNFIHFIYTFFSISILLRTLFSPWKRMQDTQGGEGFIEGWLGKIIINSMMRLVGAVIRLILIIIGLLCMVVACGLSIVTFVFWLLLPVLAVGVCIWSIKEIFT